MNVLVLTPWYPVRAGETEGLFVKQQSDALAGAGCKVVAISPRPRWLPVPGNRGSYWRNSAGLPQHTVVDGIDVYLPRYTILPRQIGWYGVGASCFRSMRRLLEGLNRQHGFDVVLGHEFLPVGLSLSYLKRIVRRPIAFTVHGQNAAVGRFLGKSQGAVIKSKMWESVDQVIAVGSPLLGWLESLGAHRSQIKVIPNGVGRIEGSPQFPDDYVERYRNKRVILSVSNLFGTKGIDLNIRALRSLKDDGFENLHYIVIGEGPCRSELTRLTTELGLKDSVTFLGRLPRKETLAYMNACELFSLPSWQEAFGIVYVEAMALAKPAIGCLGQGASDIITNGKDGLLVEPQNLESLTAGLRSILDRPGLAAQLGAAASKRARRFSWERNAQAYIELFEAMSPADRERCTGAPADGESDTRSSIKRAPAPEQLILN